MKLILLMYAIALMYAKYPNRNWSHYKHAIAMKIGKNLIAMCLEVFPHFTASKKTCKICMKCVCFIVAVFVCLLFWGFSCILFQSFIYK